MQEPPSPEFKWVISEFLNKLKIKNLNHYSRTELSKIREREITFFVKQWRLIAQNDFYSLLRLLLPQRDSRQYNLKESTLIRSICAIIGLPKGSDLETTLIGRKKDTKQQRLSESLVYELSQRNLTSDRPSNISVKDLNLELDALSSRALGHQFGYQSLAKDESFLYFIKNMNNSELVYLFDVLLKHKILSGTIEKKLLKAFHPQAELYLSVVSDLKVVCENLADPHIFLNSESQELNLTVGKAFAPHLSKKLNSFSDILSKMGENPFYIEEKLDGERIQIHYMDYGTSVKFYSRNGVDNSNYYGSSINEGIISQYINLHKSVKNCILDGEMVTMDTSTNEIMPFGIVKSSALNELKLVNENTLGFESQKPKNNFRPLFIVFDMILLNDVVFLEYPLSKRKEYLEKVLTPVSGRIEIIKGFQAKTENDIKQALDHAIRVDSEGIIIKKMDSFYKIGARNDDWIKVKPEYLEYFGEEMDLIVMGRIPQKKPTYICGLKLPVGFSTNLKNTEEQEKNELQQYRYISFCKISNGISKYEDELIKFKTKNKWISFAHENPSMMEFGTEVPVQWISPENSFVLEVKSRSINFSEQSVKKFKAGSTLTGGYCKSIRFDKDYKSCATYQNFLDMSAHARNKTNSVFQQEFQDNKRKRKIGRGRFHLVDEDLGHKKTKKQSNLLKGFSFYVLTDYISDNGLKKISKLDISQMINSHGGKVISNIRPNMKASKVIIMTSKRTYECVHWMKLKYDIVDISWLIACLQTGKLLKLEPKYCFSVSKSLYLEATKMVDEFGDSNQLETDEETLNNIVEYYDPTALPASIDMSFDEQNDFNGMPLFMFHGLNFYIMTNSISHVFLTYLKNLILLYRGNVVDSIFDASIIVVPGEDDLKKNPGYAKNAQQALDIVSSLVSKTDSFSTANIPAVVNSQWIEKCSDELFLCDKSGYRVFQKKR